ncbi:MAG: QueT transporter family protein [Oscillospiraceae bacterium]|nr:QueT transporter family protein [Oscillospiraceae bacterium]
MNRKTRYLTHGALIAAMYVALTFAANLLGLASGVVQIRLSEALTILPLFTPAAVPGLFVGCILANVLTGCALWDVVFGSIATLLGALGTYWCRKKSKYLAPVFPILANMVIVPLVLQYVYGAPDAWIFLVMTVGIGEVISCGVLGILLHRVMSKTDIFEK